MSKVEFEIEVEGGEVADVIDGLKDLVQDMGYPVYSINVRSGNGTCHTQAGGSPAEESFAEFAGRQLYEEETADDTDPGIVLPGMVVEIGGLVYQVFSVDATGRLVLDVLEELDNDILQ